MPQINLSNEELKMVVASLSKVQPGFLPFELFLQIARLVTLPIYELVPLRKNHTTIEILLLDRETNDPLWPSMLHVPGTVIRATDKSEKQAFERIVTDELKNLKVSEPQLVKSYLHTSKRGSEFAQVYWVEVLEEPKIGQFYEVNSLPSNTIESQLELIQIAVEHLRAEGN